MTCSTAGATQWGLTPSFARSYYLVLLHDGARQGSYGDASSGAERLPGLGACHAQVLASPVCS